jgi:hypothetical protein
MDYPGRKYITGAHETKFILILRAMQNPDLKHIKSRYRLELTANIRILIDTSVPPVFGFSGDCQA